MDSKADRTAKGPGRFRPAPRLVALILCLGALIGPSWAQPVASLMPLPEHLANDLTAIGRINAAGYRTKGTCTGTLVAPDAVLTAAHCLIDEHGQPKDLARGVFVAGYRQLSYIALERASHVQVHPQFDYAKGAAPHHDIAILRLLRPILDVAPMPVSVPGDAGIFALAGYHRRIPHVLSGSLTCRALARNAFSWRLDCPVLNGNSGSPVMLADADGWRVVGVVSAQTRGNQAIAVRLDTWVTDALSDKCAAARRPPGCR